jgi:dienelactone hydrolase
MKILLTLALSILIAGSAFAKLHEQAVEYSSDGLTMKGYIAYDDTVKGKRPGVLVVHEWWGYNEYARTRARMLAGLGYTAMALDMYGNGKQAEHPDDAGKFSSEVMKNMPVAKERFIAAMDLLKKQPTVDSSKIGAIGYCFGGGVVLNMATLGVDLDGVVSFHGSLGGVAAPAKPGVVKARILVCAGEADPFVPKDVVEAFRKEMHDAKASYTINMYPGAKHSFTNPGADAYGKKFHLPLEYNEKADKQSWAAMKEFFRKIFKK